MSYPQISNLRSGCDILVATPGRLLDLAQQRLVDLSKIQVLVLDEADRMLDMGFINDIRKIIRLLPPKRQNLLFSATYSDDIRASQNGYCTIPCQSRSRRAMPPSSWWNSAPTACKRSRSAILLVHLIQEGQWHQVLIFTRTKHGANRLTQQLEGAGIKAAAIHGNKSQAARVKALDMFKRGQVTALVATEVAARGLDIKELPQVVNYELPNVPEDYVHRIGRTGRAGAAGEAVSLVSSDEIGAAARHRAGPAAQHSRAADAGVQDRRDPRRQPAAARRHGGPGDRPHRRATRHGNRPASGQGRRGSPRRQAPRWPQASRRRPACSGLG